MTEAEDHSLFLEAYGQIQDEKERLGFLRGYLFALPSREMTDFMSANFDKGFFAYEHIFNAGMPFEKSEAKIELEQAIGLLKTRPGTAT